MATNKKIVRSSCRMCHGVCQVLVHLEDDRVVKVTGDPDSIVSRGYLCPKGAASVELLYHKDRLLYPLKRAGNKGENRWQRISWDEALSEMAGRLDCIRRESGPEYFGMLQGTGRPHTMFNSRFANAFGTPNFVGGAHICYFPRLTAAMITLGQMPIADIYGFGGKTPACVLLWGCSIGESGSADGMCGGMLERAMAKADKTIVIDPRKTKAAGRASLWLQVRPGTDCALALAMISTIIAEDLIDREFVAGYTKGFEELKAHSRAFTPEWAEPVTGIAARDIRDAARIYATHKPSIIQWGNGTDMNRCNFHTARAQLILRAITGNIDRPGSDVFWVSPTNVGLQSPLVNPEILGKKFLAARPPATPLDQKRYPFSSAVHPPEFWKAVISEKPYLLRGLWIVGSNPLVSMTHSSTIEKALRKIEYLVVSEFFMTPTAQFADLVLPASTWLEQNDVVNFHKIWCILARKKLAQEGECRDDREIVLELAHRLGLEEAFPWASLDEYLQSLLADSKMSFDEFCQQGIVTGEMVYEKYKQHSFPTPSGKVELHSSVLASMGIEPLPIYREPVATTEEYPFILTSGGKIRYFFHSEGRQIESLRKKHPEPQVTIHPDAAARWGITNGCWIWIETRHGKIQMRAKVDETVAVDVISVEHGWWYPEEAAPEYGWKRSCANLLFGEEACDPETGSEPLRSFICKVYTVEPVLS